jgi:hypothetical protein
VLKRHVDLSRVGDLAGLRVVRLEQARDPIDLGPLSEARSLEELHVYPAGPLSLESLAHGHPTLKRITVPSWRRRKLVVPPELAHLVVAR